MDFSALSWPYPNTMLLAENRRLRDQIAELKAELAIAYGHQRAAH